MCTWKQIEIFKCKSIRMTYIQSLQFAFFSHHHHWLHRAAVSSFSSCASVFFMRTETQNHFTKSLFVCACGCLYIFCCFFRWRISLRAFSCSCFLQRHKLWRNIVPQNVSLSLSLTIYIYFIVVGLVCLFFVLVFYSYLNPFWAVNKRFVSYWNPKHWFRFARLDKQNYDYVKCKLLRQRMNCDYGTGACVLVGISRPYFTALHSNRGSIHISYSTKKCQRKYFQKKRHEKTKIK